MPSDESDTERNRGSGPAQNVMMSEGEWQGLIDILRAASDGQPEEATKGMDRSTEYFMTNYADYIEENRRDWP